MSLANNIDNLTKICRQITVFLAENKIPLDIATASALLSIGTWMLLACGLKKTEIAELFDELTDDVLFPDKSMELFN